MIYARKESDNNVFVSVYFYGENLYRELPFQMNVKWKTSIRNLGKTDVISLRAKFVKNPVPGLSVQILQATPSLRVATSCRRVPRSPRPQCRPKSATRPQCAKKTRVVRTLHGEDGHGLGKRPSWSSRWLDEGCCLQGAARGRAHKI